MQKFKVTCLNCGSDNCEITYDFDYDIDYEICYDTEEREVVSVQDNGLTISCLDCGNKYNTFDICDEDI